jgi:pimeloyl-ACP methyl ester carboxylesterase
MKKAILYIHGKGGSAAEAEQYRKYVKDADVIGVAYEVDFPWKVESRLQAAYEDAAKEYAQISILANSIGSYFAMNTLQHREIQKAYFISPILDMERLILDMMSGAGVSEEELREKGEIPTSFGETLSWEYLCYVRSRPIVWNVPTEILYAEGDALTSRQTVEQFANTHNARLTAMKNGEHWFHTEEQLAFLGEWMDSVL